MCHIALKVGYWVVLEFGSNVDPPPNASGGVDLRNSPFPGPTLVFLRKYYGVANSPETGLQGGTGVRFKS